MSGLTIEWDRAEGGSRCTGTPSALLAGVTDYEAAVIDEIRVARPSGAWTIYTGLTIAMVRAIEAHQRRAPLHIEATAVPRVWGAPWYHAVFAEIIVHRVDDFTRSYPNHTLDDVWQKVGGLPAATEAPHA